MKSQSFSMRASPAVIGLAAIAGVIVGCSRSALDVAGGLDDGGGFGVTATGDEASATDVTAAPDGSVTPSDVSLVGQEDTAPSGQHPDATEIEVEASGGDGSLADALPGLPCLERTQVGCDCTSDVCSSQYVRLRAAILNAIGSCRLACVSNDFTFDGNGCATGYTHEPDPEYRDDTCVLQALGNVRFSCTTGAERPFFVYWPCTLM
jgi:hypothetical protein